MRKFFCTVSIFMFLFAFFLGCEANAKYRTIDFQGNKFHLYKIEENDKVYDIVNRFYSEGIEQSKLRDELVLFYANSEYPDNNYFEKFEKEYSQQYVIGKKFKNYNLFALSFIGEYKENFIYSIVKFENNTDSSGVSVTQLYINVSKKDVSQKKIIKKLDEKYFDYFINMKLPPTVDKSGKIIPEKYYITALNKIYMLKFSQYVSKYNYGRNYYLSPKESLTDYTSLIRVNYTNARQKPETMFEEIVNDQKINQGFKLISLEKTKNGIIGSYMSDLINLSTSKKYKQLSVLKLISSPDGVRGIEILERIPLDKDVETKVDTQQKRYYNYLLNSEIPPLVKDNFGALPAFDEDNYFTYSKGLSR